MIFNKDEKFPNQPVWDLHQLWIERLIEESYTSFDLDEVLVHLSIGSANFIYEVYGERITTQEQVKWSYIVDKYPKIIEYWADWEGYSSIPMIKGSKEFIKKVKKIVGENGVQIVTSSPSAIIEKKDTLGSRNV